MEEPIQKKTKKPTKKEQEDSDSSDDDRKAPSNQLNMVNFGGGVGNDFEQFGEEARREPNVIRKSLAQYHH